MRRRLVVCGVLIVGSAALLAGVVAWFSADGNMRFGVLDFHSERWGNVAWSFAWFKQVGTDVISNQLPILVCFLWSLGIVVFHAARNTRSGLFTREDVPYLLLLLLCYVTTTAVHASRAVMWPHHQTSNVIFVVVFSAIVVDRFFSSLPRDVVQVLCLALVSLLVLAMPLQEYVIRLSGDGSFARSREALQIIRRVSPGKGPILTLQAQLALESGLPLLPGYELSEFSYFKNMAEDRAAKFRLVTFNRLKEDLRETKARVLCLTDRDLRILGKNLRTGGKEDEMALRRLIQQNYVVAARVEQYGQFFEPLHIYAARTD